MIFVHLATNSKLNTKFQKLKKFIDSNLFLGLDLIDFMKKYSYKNLIISESYWQFDRSGKYRSHSLYAISKSYFSIMANYYANYEGLNVKTMVLYDTFGNNDNRLKIMNELKKSIQKNTYVKMTKGEQILDFVHIDDVVSAFNLLFDMFSNFPKDTGFARYVVRGLRPLSLKKHIKLIEKVLGVFFNIKWGAIKYPINQIFHPWLPNKSYLIPGWSPKLKYESRIKSFFNNGC